MDESFKQIDEIIKESILLKKNNFNKRYQNESQSLKTEFIQTFNETELIFQQQPKFELVKDYCKNIITTCKMEKEVFISQIQILLLDFLGQIKHINLH